MLDGNLRELEVFSPSVRDHAIKALIVLSKYLGVYELFKARMKNYGIKTSRPDAFSSFLRMFNSNSEDLLEWYREALSVLRVNERLYLKFVALTGIRKSEALESFNLIIQLYKLGRLDAYYDQELCVLEHFKFKEKFLRRTKNVYISFVPEKLVLEIVKSRPVTYEAITKRLRRRGLETRINELRDYYATFMVRHGLIREEVDLLQGRIPPNIFIRHYWSPSFKDLRDRTLKAVRQLEQSL